MARRVKCPECGQLNEKENTKEKSRKYYCPECYEIAIARSEKNTDGWAELYNYICDLTGSPPTGRMFKQLSDYRKEPYNYTNEGMRLTLYYFYELMENPLKEGTLGIIPYIYEEAKQDYIQRMDIDEHNSTMKYVPKTVVVRVNPTKMPIEKKTIDFNDLDFEGEVMAI